MAIKFSDTLKRNWLLYVLLGLMLLYGIVWLTTPKPIMPDNLQATIEALEESNKKLVEQQKQLDDRIETYHKRVDSLDQAIGTVKEKTTIIREYYHELSGRVDKYTPTQIDSFFKARYNY